MLRNKIIQLHTLILFGSLSVSLTSCGQHDRKNPTEFRINHEYWEGCETGQGKCEPLVFERKSINESLILIMPCGGTLTTVYLTKEGQEKPLDTLNIDHNDCPPTFDLTGLADGNYGAYMLACNLGGGVKFMIRTKK